MTIFYPPAPFDLQRARTCIELVALAYDLCDQWEEQGKPKGSDFVWTCSGPDRFDYSAPLWGYAKVLHFFKDYAPFGFVAHEGDTGYLVFRGTQTVEDGLADLDADLTEFELAPGFGEAHDGFVDLYSTLSEGVREAVAALPGEVTKLVVTGHSMGAAFSTLAVADLSQSSRFSVALEHYNQASPRVASVAFARRYGELGVPTYRLVNTSDLVPQLPPPLLAKDHYAHVGAQISFTHNAGHATTNHSLAETYRPAIEG